MTDGYQTPRQDALLEKRQRLRETKKLKAGEPLPGDLPLDNPRSPINQCPSCRGQMKFFPARGCYLCTTCQYPI